MASDYDNVDAFWVYTVDVIAMVIDNSLYAQNASCIQELGIAQLGNPWVLVENNKSLK